MNMLAIGIFVAMIAAGILIKIYQKNKYFYVGSFVYHNDTSSMVINLAATGCYTINVTKVSSDPNKEATFEIEEGKYQKATQEISMHPDQRIVYTYKNTEKLMLNKWSTHKKMALKDFIISIKGKELAIDNNKLCKFSSGKTISNKKFLK